MQPYSIPVQITLQGSRKRQGRAAPPSSGPRTCRVASNSETSVVPRQLPSSAGEDRATLLGLAMMAASVLMFFLLGITVLRPAMLSPPKEESNCTAIHTRITDDWLSCTLACEVACPAQGRFPCLQVFVNLSGSSQRAFLHYDEEAAQSNAKCFYTPKCHRDRDNLLSSILDIKEFFDHRNGSPFICFSNAAGQSDGAVLMRTRDHTVVFHCLFWPSLTLVGGVLIVGMVRLTQHLSFLCDQYSITARAQASSSMSTVGRGWSIL